MRRSDRRPARMGRVLTILFLAVIELAWIGNAASAVGRPLYPDLLTNAPSGLYIERGPDGKYLLRFANTAVNLGGRLEIAVGTGTRDIYQNVYDQYSGGNRVIHQKVGADLIYHPQHNHFHFEDFAKYELLKRDSAGFYRPTSQTGSKTTFCILDTIRVGMDGPATRKYDGCGATVQGLSAGWGDTYIASLFGQWIELGSTMIPDGSYAIRSTADPDNKLMELNDFNNVGLVYFSIRNGRLFADSLPPLCSVESVNGGATGSGSQVNAIVGSTVRVRCLRFGPHEQVDVFWGSVNTAPRATVTSSSGGAATAHIQVPQSSLGVHYVIARGRESGAQVAAVVNTMPSIAVTPRRGVVGTEIQATLRGFSATEQVNLIFSKTESTSSSIALVSVGRNGSASASFPIPVSPYGSHAVEAVGVSSGARARASLVVMPSMQDPPEEVEAGATVGVSLRGFVAGERVQFALDGSTGAIGSAVTSHSGSTTPSTAHVLIPIDTTPGEHLLTATGDRSRLPVRVEITVTEPDTSEIPEPTPTLEATATSTPAAEPSPATGTPASPTPTSTAEPTATGTSSSPTPQPNGSPVAIAPPDLVVIDEGGDGAELVTLDGTASTDPDGDALSYAWSRVEQPVDGEPLETLLSAEPTAGFSLPVGEHTISLTVTDSSGAAASDTVIVRIEPPPP